MIYPQWESDGFEHWLWDATLPMRSRSGSANFEAFFEALQHMAQWKGCCNMCHVLDDFLMVSNGDEVAEKRLKTLLGLCEDLGIPVVEDKTEQGQCIVFLSTTLYTIKMEARLLWDKLDRCLTQIRTYQSRNHITVSQVGEYHWAPQLCMPCGCSGAALLEETVQP